MMIDNDVMKLFKESLEFLESHPALACGGFTPNGYIPPYHTAPFETHIFEFCKNNWALDMAPPYITIYSSNPRFKEFYNKMGVDAISKGLKTGVRGNEEYLEVDYQLFYGYPWKGDHFKVCAESGHRRVILKSQYGTKPRWESWHDSELDASGKTYEEAVINMANNVRKKYGDFNNDNIVPKYIESFNFHMFSYMNNDMSDIMASFTHPLRRCMVRITDAELNEIWWQTFAKNNNIKEDVEGQEYLDVSKYLDKNSFDEYSTNNLYEMVDDKKDADKFLEYFKSQTN